MEEIDIIELLKRVKEGKAPKRIEIEGYEFYYDETKINIDSLYATPERPSAVDYWCEINITLDTKIKILDEHKIEKLEEKIHGISLGDTNRTLLYTIKKINEIIKKINGEEK